MSDDFSLNKTGGKQFFRPWLGFHGLIGYIPLGFGKGWGLSSGLGASCGVGVPPRNH